MHLGLQTLSATISIQIIFNDRIATISENDLCTQSFGHEMGGAFGREWSVWRPKPMPKPKPLN
jgi:hypothetical protein